MGEAPQTGGGSAVRLRRAPRTPDATNRTTPSTGSAGNPYGNRWSAGPCPAGVMQAQYNLLLHLNELPDARSLRVVMDSQRVVAHEAATRISDVEPQLAAKWTTRKQTYSKLVQETRDLAGMLGKPNAASQSAIAANRAEKLTREP